jgi:hypothetical protein
VSARLSATRYNGWSSAAGLRPRYLGFGDGRASTTTRRSRKTVGEVRETSDEILLSFPDLGEGSVAHLRETLDLPSCDGVRPLGKKPA